MRLYQLIGQLATWTLPVHGSPLLSVFSFVLVSVFIIVKKVKEVAPTGRCRARWIRLVTTDSLDPTRQAGPDPVML